MLKDFYYKMGRFLQVHVRILLRPWSTMVL